MALMVMSVMALFFMMLKTSATVVNVASTSLDAANAVQRVTSSLREARRFSLLDDSTHDATDTSGNVVAVTGMRIYYPAASASVVVNTAAGGTSTVTLSGTSAVYNRTADGVTLDFYRSDSSGTPAPNTGTCLWESGTERGVSVSRAIVKDISPETTAIQFIQPYLPDGVTPIKNDVKVVIVTGVYDRNTGNLSSNSTRGTKIALTGEHVYLRDHDPNGEYSGGSHGHSELPN